MKKEEVLDLLVNTKSISPFSRNLISWLYKNEYIILSPEEVGWLYELEKKDCERMLQESCEEFK